MANDLRAAHDHRDIADFQVDLANAAAAAHWPLERGVRRLDSLDLFDGSTEIQIRHGDAVYRLRQTALGKLILTK